MTTWQSQVCITFKLLYNGIDGFGIWVGYLLIGSSAPVERIFSRGKRLISPVRSSLGPDTVRACMLLKDDLLREGHDTLQM